MTAGPYGPPVPAEEASPRSVRYVVQIAHSVDGVSGWVQKEGRARQPFSTWLELLSLLERPGTA